MDRVGSKFALVSLAAKRGRQINSYFNQLGEGLGAIVPPQVTSVSRKPLSIAMEEIAADKIVMIPAEVIDETDETENKSAPLLAAVSSAKTSVSEAGEDADADGSGESS